MLFAGAVHEGKLCAPRVNSQDGRADLITYNFNTRGFSAVKVICDEVSRQRNSLYFIQPGPAGCLEQLLAVHDDVLIRYGRKPWQPACLHCYALHVYEACDQMYCMAYSMAWPIAIVSHCSKACLHVARTYIHTEPAHRRGQLGAAPNTRPGWGWLQGIPFPSVEVISDPAGVAILAVDMRDVHLPLPFVQSTCRERMA